MTDIVYDPYATVPLSDFIPELVFEIPELPEEMAMYHVRKAVIEFARRSLVLRRKVDIHTYNCVDNYILEAPDCSEVLAIHNICNVTGTCCGKPVRLTHAPCGLPSCGVSVWREEPNIVWISPGRDGACYRVEISVAPTRDVCEVDKILYDKYFENILVGAKMYLYGIARRPWSSQDLANAARLEFDRKIATAMLDTALGGQVGAIRIKTRKTV